MAPFQAIIRSFVLLAVLQSIAIVGGANNSARRQHNSLGEPSGSTNERALRVTEQNEGGNCDYIPYYLRPSAEDDMLSMSSEHVDFVEEARDPMAAAWYSSEDSSDESSEDEEELAEDPYRVHIIENGRAALRPIDRPAGRRLVRTLQDVVRNDFDHILAFAQTRIGPNLTYNNLWHRLLRQEPAAQELVLAYWREKYPR